MLKGLLRLAVLSFALLAFTPAVAEDPRLGQTQTELKQLRERIEAVNRQLAGDRAERDGLRTALQSAEQQASRAAEQLAGIEKDLAAQQAEVGQARVRQRRAAADLEQHTARLAEQVRAAYLIGKQSRLKLLLSQEDPARVQRTLTYFDYVNRARVERITAVSAAVSALREAEQELRAGETQLIRLRDGQKAALDRLVASRAERERTISAIERRLSQGSAELTQLARDESKLQSLIEELRNVLADIPARIADARPLNELRGQLPWPASGQVLAGFGQPKAGGRMTWKGVWIAADEGTPVRAVAHGRVAWVGWMHRYGLVVVIEHTGGYFSLYGHAQSSALRTGEWVRAGDTVAQAGNTGGHDRSGVYLELRRGADPVDPIGWLSRRTASR
jgi:septal ring factor EnvC (AmiA/AmiB activator)